MIISLLVAASSNNVIGKNNQLLWTLPNDMKYFKNVTWAMPVIMGRKTFESLHNKALHGRINIILTSRKQLSNAHGSYELVSSIEEANKRAEDTDCNEVFVIGGGEIFEQYMPIADKIYVTRVNANLDGDAYFPEIDHNKWTLSSSNPFPADEKHKYAYDFQIWTRR
jgi:dihydrofolate reductase